MTAVVYLTCVCHTLYVCTLYVRVNVCVRLLACAVRSECVCVRLLLDNPYDVVRPSELGNTMEEGFV